MAQYSEHAAPHHMHTVSCKMEKENGFQWSHRHLKYSSFQPDGGSSFEVAHTLEYPSSLSYAIAILQRVVVTPWEES